MDFRSPSETVDFLLQNLIVINETLVFESRGKNSFVGKQFSFGEKLVFGIQLVNVQRGRIGLKRLAVPAAQVNYARIVLRKGKVAQSLRSDLVLQSELPNDFLVVGLFLFLLRLFLKGGVLFGL